RILARPDASLRNHVDLGRGLAAAGSYVLEAYRVGMFDPRLQNIACHRSEGAIQAEISAEWGSAHAVDARADFLQRALEGRDRRNHADRARDGRRARPDLIGPGADVVAAGCRHAPHRHDDGLAFGAQRLDLAIDLLGSKDAPSGAVHAQHDCLDVIVVARIAQDLRGRVAADRAGWLLAIEDFAGRDHHADLVLRS